MLESGATNGVLVALAAALLLGLRHATDPDHLTAVSTLVLSERGGNAHRAGALGLAWGLGHAATLLACGLPLVLLGQRLPEVARRGAEALAGAVIVVLALRLWQRWRRGYFHVHPHRHGDLLHAHPHVHEESAATDHEHAGHEHRHAEALGRSPVAAFGIGLAHGAGGSAGAGMLVIAALPAGAPRAAGLIAFAGGTALSMALASTLLGAAVAHSSMRRRFEQAIPWIGAAGCACGTWYLLAALGLVT